MEKRIQVNTSLVAFKYANDVFKGLDHEELWILYKDAGDRRALPLNINDIRGDIFHLTAKDGDANISVRSFIASEKKYVYRFIGESKLISNFRYFHSNFGFTKNLR